MLKISNVKKTFNKGTVNEKVVFDGLNLEVNEGDFITIIGSNGAGKSTLFNLIAGSYYPDEGNILLDNVDITYKESFIRSKSIGRLFQDPSLGTAAKMSIEENLALATKGSHWFTLINKKERAYFKEELVKLDMGLENRLKQPVGLLSGGQRQALTLLMATLNPPKILLLDEHTAALDPKAAEKVMNITNNIIKENNLTCLMVTHNMSTALEYGNRLIMMQNGKIVVDLKGEDKKNLTVNDLLELFKKATNKELENDRMLLSSNESTN